MLTTRILCWTLWTEFHVKWMNSHTRNITIIASVAQELVLLPKWGIHCTYSFYFMFDVIYTNPICSHTQAHTLHGFYLIHEQIIIININILTNKQINKHFTFRNNIDGNVWVNGWEREMKWWTHQIWNRRSTMLLLLF